MHKIMRCVQKLQLGTLTGKHHLGYLGLDGRIGLK